MSLLTFGATARPGDHGHGGSNARRIATSNPLDPPTRQRIRSAIEHKLQVHPEAHAKPLAHTTQRLRSLRVGDCRVIFALRDDELWIVRIGQRRDGCEETGHRRPPDDPSVSTPDSPG